MQEKIDIILEKLSRSNFHSSFHLKEKERQYFEKNGILKIESHARDFIGKRLAPLVIENDGKQTPMRGHPVFIAQHATATCCRGCLEKWHHIPKNKNLTDQEQDYIVNVIMEWLKREIEKE